LYKNNGCLHEDKYRFLIISRSGLSRIKMFLTDILEKIRSHIVRSNLFFENRTLYEVMWKNSAELVMLQMTI